METKANRGPIEKKKGVKNKFKAGAESESDDRKHQGA